MLDLVCLKPYPSMERPITSLEMALELRQFEEVAIPQNTSKFLPCLLRDYVDHVAVSASHARATTPRHEWMKFCGNSSACNI